MFTLRIDSSQLVQNLSEIEKRALPGALVSALNDTAAQVREAWRDEMLTVFDRPVELTLNAVLYRKATPENLSAEIFIRDEASKGTPPNKYLFSEVMGGTRRAKRSEVQLRRAGVLGDGEFWVPGIGAQLDPGGNISGSTVRTVLSDLEASYDPKQWSTSQSRQKRSRRRDVNKRAIFFYSRGRSGNRGDGRPQHLPRGIYERTRTGFGSALRMIMHVVSSVQYKPRLNVVAVAERLFNQRFRRNFDARMTLLTSRRRR